MKDGEQSEMLFWKGAKPSALNSIKKTALTLSYGTTVYSQVSRALGSNVLLWVRRWRSHDPPSTSELERQRVRDVAGSLQKEAGL